MDATTALAYGRDLYGDHPAAPVLILEAVQGATEERRQRSAKALVALDPMTSVATEDPLQGVKAAIIDGVELVFRAGTLEERTRIAKTLMNLIEVNSAALRRIEAEGRMYEVHESVIERESAWWRVAARAVREREMAAAEHAA